MALDVVAQVRAGVSAPLELFRRRMSGRWWDESSWVTERSAPRLALEHVPTRQLIDDGYGAPVTRVYRIDLADATGNLADLFASFVQGPNRFLRRPYAYFTPNALLEGSRVTVQIGGPWNGPVEVLVVDSCRCLLATRSGHLEAGWIEFSIDVEASVFQVRSTATAGDPAFWVLHKALRIGRWVQADMWTSLCENFAREAGVSVLPTVVVSTVEHDE